MSKHDNNSGAKPFLKWAGGKSQLLQQLEQYFPEEFNRYFEPFVGGGAVFFYASPSQAVLNDINDKLINAYRHIKNDLDILTNELKKIEKEYLSRDLEERKSYFYKKREEYNSLENSISKTVLLVFLNKTCFNGMYRENSKGDFNVPHGRYSNPTILDEKNLRAVSKSLQGVILLSESYQDAVKDAKKGDFIYLDPPYFPLNETSSFTGYSKDGFNKEDQVALRDLFVELDKRGCYVMLSNSYTPFIMDIYKDYKQEAVSANRFVNSKASGRGKIKELVVLNY